MDIQDSTLSAKVISTDKEVNRWAKYLHYSLYLVYIFPLLGVFIPFWMWNRKKKKSPFVDLHGKIVLNWIMSLFIYVAIFTVIKNFFDGYLNFIILGLMAFIFPLIGGIKAGRGEVWDYPLSAKFFR